MRGMSFVVFVLPVLWPSLYLLPVLWSSLRVYRLLCPM